MVKNSGSLERRLAAYGSMSLAFAAVSIPSAARADIITTLANVTTGTNGPAGAVFFDILNGTYGKNGVNGFTATSMDFELVTSASALRQSYHAKLLVSPNNTVYANNHNAFVHSAASIVGNGHSIAKISPGVVIGPNLVFSNVAGTLADGSSPYFGHWNSRPAWADVGLVIKNGANLNYGWANIQVNGNYTITLLEFGIDNTGAAVAAGAVPEPSSILLLALGAAGIAAWRKKKARPAD